MDTFRWRCNENNDKVDRFIKQQNTATDVSEIAQDHLDRSAEQTVGAEMVIKTEVTSPGAAKDLHLTQKNCTAGDEPFEAEENPTKLEYVDVDELYRLQTNAILDHEQDDLQTNPLELVCQDREDHSMNNMCADATELLIKTEDTSPDTSKDLHLNQKCFTVHEANGTYECCGKIPDDLFEADENPIAIKSEYEDGDEQHLLQTTNDSLNHEQDNLKSQSKKRKYDCSHCSSSFANLSSLKVHIRTHTGERPYVCKVCDKTFTSSKTLLQHSKIHNKDQQHQCPYCPSMFAQSYNLKVHIRAHMGERPYVCKVCHKAFRSPHSLLEHSKIHNKEQHHQCPHCSSRFPWLASLKVHIRTHTGERPYVCKVCYKAFRSPNSLFSQCTNVEEMPVVRDQHISNQV
ncbi:zinc finger protein OZF-like [Anopheles cruzii]|uniref:zinc finger protein OZF-like n=1 Tax=Anopheles cruzii TaxID=68878 RepID=UPI0022EC3E6E|nr:zinc finger protein OZF-like [Anopheles cruzii]